MGLLCKGKKKENFENINHDIMIYILHVYKTKGFRTKVGDSMSQAFINIYIRLRAVQFVRSEAFFSIS